MIFTGYELAGTASTLLLFSQGTASVAMDFRSPSTDPIPTAAVIETGTRQAARPPTRLRLTRPPDARAGE